MDTCTPWTHLPVLLKGLYRSFLCITCYKNSFHLEFIFYIGSVQGVLSVQKKKGSHFPFTALGEFYLRNVYPPVFPFRHQFFARYLTAHVPCKTQVDYIEYHIIITIPLNYITGKVIVYGRKQISHITLLEI